MPIFTPRLTSLNENEVRRYARAEKLDKTLIDEAILDLLISAKPEGIYNIYDYDSKNSMIFFGNGRISLVGNSIKKHLGLSEKAAVLALTIGEDIEDMISDSSKKDRYAHALLLDAAATEAVEEAADLLEKVIEREAGKEGFHITSRFSPGYGDFPLSMQEDILALASGKEIGISLTSALMLTPRKSITAIIGFKRENTKRANHDCKNCAKTNCAFRKGE